VGWRLRIEHTTSVTYAGPALTSFNEARMTPLTLPTQVTLVSRVSAGHGVPVWTYNDYWGTYVSVFDLPEPHDELVIRAAATVETGPPRATSSSPAAATTPTSRRLKAFTAVPRAATCG
jgi:transglutaminase-like putative cysteine protease